MRETPVFSQPGGWESLRKVLASRVSARPLPGVARTTRGPSPGARREREPALASLPLLVGTSVLWDWGSLLMASSNLS